MRFLNITGMKFNRLTVIKRSERVGTSKVIWECRCDCGNKTYVASQSLRNGTTKSCGCYNSEISKKNNTTHGLSASSEYYSWASMIQRCTNPNNKDYEEYANRGIKVCDRWKESFNNFIEDMGFKPTKRHTIERIDNDGGYNPGNCRWATRSEQSLNTRHNVLINHHGVDYTLSQLAAKFQVGYFNLRDRLRKGMSLEESVEELGIIAQTKKNNLRYEFIKLHTGELPLSAIISELLDKTFNVSIRVTKQNSNEYNVFYNYDDKYRTTQEDLNILIRTDGSLSLEDK